MTDCGDNAIVPGVAHRDYERYTPRPLCGLKDACPSRLPANRPLPPQITMQSNSLRATALLAITFGVLLSCVHCQAPLAKTQFQAPAASTGASAPELPAKNDAGNLPGFLLKVPGGTVLIGTEIDSFADACAQAAFSFDPKNAHKNAADKYKTALRRSSSMIGRKQYQVEEFYLGKWPVKNSEYIVFVNNRRAAGAEVRPPFHWWRYGCEKDYEERLTEIRKLFPKNSRGPINYWESKGHELPYKAQDEDGKSLADHPVVFITWREANAFAASIGMRLPTELELERAMRGDSTHCWPGGERGPEFDKYTEKMLNYLGMARTSDLHTKPVGTVQGAYGPFGHWDMFGQVWQMVGDLGFDPIHKDMDFFVKQWKLLQKHKTARIVEKKPTFQGHLTIAKGGSFLSYQEPVQLMIDARAPIQTTACLESLGMRLAKSIAPGYDYLYSLQRVQFNTEAFAKDQDLNLRALVGAERYTLGANDFPTNYEAAAFAPVNFLSTEKGAKIKGLTEATMKKPMLIGALATTANFGNGSKHGLYSVFYRQAGIPKELRDATKAGYREVTKARKEEAKQAKADEKAGKKGGKKADDEKDAKKKKPKTSKKQDQVRKWRMIAKKYGLSDDDVVSSIKAANGDCGYVIIDGIKIPTDRDAFILSTKGKMVSVLPGTKKKPVKLPAFPSTIEMAADEGQKAKMTAKFRFGIPLVSNKPKIVVVFDLHAVLDLTEGKPWRLPKEANPKDGK
ncbi:MAG: sulfatase activating formylglycine-generating enzyme [Planctomycetota bacterium]|jgi:formylglycine-generating enzyme required for sulfatase activity